MIKILCTFVLLFIGQGAFSSQSGISDLSEASGSVLSSTQDPEELAAGSEVEFLAGLQKDLQKTKIILNTDFSSFCGSSRPLEKIPVKSPEIIPNLSTAKIIYPFHSFP